MMASFPAGDTHKWETNMHLGKNWMVLGVLAAALAALPAMAQQQAAPKNAQEAKAAFAEKFRQADADSDGKLSRQEAEAGMPEVAKNFDKIDTKKTGYVTQKQVGAYFVARAKQKRTASDPGSLN